MSQIDLVATKLAVMARVHRACLTVSCLPTDGPRTIYSTWPAYRLEFWDAEDLGSKRTDKAVTEGLIQPPKFMPTGKEIDDCLPALELLEGVDQFKRRCVAARAWQEWYDLSGGWRAVGERLHCSHKTARKAHFDAIHVALSAFLKRSQRNTVTSLLRKAFAESTLAEPRFDRSSLRW